MTPRPGQRGSNSCPAGFLFPGACDCRRSPVLLNGSLFYFYAVFSFLLLHHTADVGQSEERKKGTFQHWHTKQRLERKRPHLWSLVNETLSRQARQAMAQAGQAKQGRGAEALASAAPESDRGSSHSATAPPGTLPMQPEPFPFSRKMAP